MDMQPIIDLALAEDIGPGDLTSYLLVPVGAKGTMQLVAKEPLVLAGSVVAAQVFHTVDKSLAVEMLLADGAAAAEGDVLLAVRGSAQSLLAAERTALNFMQRACGVATLTRQYVAAVAGTKAKILDTRKTSPGLRLLDKHAVAAGGGVNHRMGLYDAVLIKDNHIALTGSVKAAVEKARGGTNRPVIVECDTLEQLREAIAAAPDRVLLDNMDTGMLREAVRIAAGRVKLEASGGITLATLREVAETGVDYISAGSLTHSVRAADISAEITTG